MDLEFDLKMLTLLSSSVSVSCCSLRQLILRIKCHSSVSSFRNFNKLTKNSAEKKNRNQEGQKFLCPLKSKWIP